MMRSDVEKLLARHRDAFSSRDAARIAGDHTELGLFESPAAGKVHGREAIENVYRYWLEAFPDMEFTWREPIIEGSRVALFWHFRGTLSGPFFGQAQRGAKIQFVGAAEYVLTSDGIHEARHVFDFTGSLISAGALRVKPAE